MGYGEDSSAGMLRGIDTWVPYDTNTEEGGNVAAQQLMSWTNPTPVSWAVTLRQRQVDYFQAGFQAFPDNFDAAAYEGGTVTALVGYDDDKSSNGSAEFQCDFGAQQSLVIPPTTRLRVDALVGANFRGEQGDLPFDESARPYRAYEVVAYARPLLCDARGGPVASKPVSFTQWVRVDALQTFETRVPRCARRVSWGSRDATTGGASTGLTAAVDYNDAVAVSLAAGPIWPENVAVRYAVPSAASRVRFVNANGAAQLLAAIVWEIEP